MSRAKILATIMCVFLSLTPALARSRSDSNSRRNSAVEFFQSMSIGSQDINISVPESFELVHHDIIGRKQTIGFIPDNANMSNWTQYIGIHIELNSPKSASENITQLQKYLKKTYPGAKVLASDISRAGNGVQEASTSVLFTDEVGEVIMTALYYSDSAKVVGTEVSQRVGKSAKRAQAAAEKTAGRVLRLNR